MLRVFCQAAMEDCRKSNPHATEVEVLLAGFLQKRLQKELPVTGNPPELQDKVEEAKGTEWCTMQSKTAVCVHTGAAAERIRQKHPDRFVGSRFVVTSKPEEVVSSRAPRPRCHQENPSGSMPLTHNVSAVQVSHTAAACLEALANVSRRHKRGILRGGSTLGNPRAVSRAWIPMMLSKSQATYMA